MSDAPPRLEAMMMRNRARAEITGLKPPRKLRPSAFGAQCVPKTWKWRLPMNLKLKVPS